MYLKVTLTIAQRMSLLTMLGETTGLKMDALYSLHGLWLKIKFPEDEAETYYQDTPRGRALDTKAVENGPIQTYELDKSEVRHLKELIEKWYEKLRPLDMEWLSPLLEQLG